MAVARIEAAHDDLSFVGLAVSVGIDQVNEVRLLSNVSASVSDFEAGRKVKAVSEDRLLIRFAVSVGVFENEQLVVRLVRWLVLRVARHRRDPESPLRVECEVDRVFQIRKVDFRGEQVDFVPLRDGE